MFKRWGSRIAPSTLGEWYQAAGNLVAPLAAHIVEEVLASEQCMNTDGTSIRVIDPVLPVDEAQRALPMVLSELCILSSANLESHNILSVRIAGDDRLLEKLQTPDLLPLSTRIKARLTLSYATPQEPRTCLDYILVEAGCPHLVVSDLITTLCERSAGNLRVLCNVSAEFLAHGAKRELK